jgi:hypothetical protein
MTNSHTDIPPKVESIEVPTSEMPYKAYSEKDVNIAGTLSPLKMPESASLSHMF